MARRISPVKTHRYTLEFKLKAVKLSSLKGVQVQDVAEALDIHPIMLAQGGPGGATVRACRGDAGSSGGAPDGGLFDSEAAVRAASGGARNPKKSHSVLFRTKAAVFALVEAERDRFGVEALCRRHGVTRGRDTTHGSTVGRAVGPKRMSVFSTVSGGSSRRASRHTGVRGSTRYCGRAGSGWAASVWRD